MADLYFDMHSEMNNSSSSGGYIFSKPNTITVIRCYISIFMKICKYIRTGSAWKVRSHLHQRVSASYRASVGHWEFARRTDVWRAQDLRVEQELCTTKVTTKQRRGKCEYYKVEGVEHFMNGFGEENGPIKLIE